MSNLTPDELARLRLKAKHGMLTPEEQQAYDDYATEQLSAVSSPPSGAVPPKKGFKWESEKVAEWRLKARHDGLDENERLLYQDYQQTLALAEADANASDAKFTGESSERQLKKSAILRGVMSLALVVLIGMYVMTGCKLSESPFLVQYTMYEINYRLTGELPDTNEVWSELFGHDEIAGWCAACRHYRSLGLGELFAKHTLFSRASRIGGRGSRRMLLRRGGERSSGHVRYDRGAPTYL